MVDGPVVVVVVVVGYFVVQDSSYQGFGGLRPGVWIFLGATGVSGFR